MSGMSVSVQWGARGKLLLLLGVFALPMLAAYLAYFGWRPAGHSNYGDLLRVAPLQQTTGEALDGAPFDLAALRGRWVMVHVGPARCDAACVHQLYLMRQTRIAQGKDQSRIERLWVLTAEGAPDAALLQAHPGLHVWRPRDPAFVAQFPAASSAGNHIYLVDPLGNLMMRFPSDPDFRRMMKDLKLLLKASQIG